jgi:hypothetical protein
MCICICTSCIYIYIYIYIYILYAYVSSGAYVPHWTSRLIIPQDHSSIYIHICICIYIYTYCISTEIHIYVQIYIRIHVQTYIHTRIAHRKSCFIRQQDNSSHAALHRRDKEKARNPALVQCQSWRETIQCRCVSYTFGVHMMSVCLSIYLSVFLSICYLSVYRLSFCLHVHASIQYRPNCLCAAVQHAVRLCVHANFDYLLSVFIPRAHQMHTMMHIHACQRDAA